MKYEVYRFEKGEEVTKERIRNQSTRLFEVAAQRIGGAEYDISDLKKLLRADERETGVRRDDRLRGTSYDKKNPSCPFDICGGDRIVTLTKGPTSRQTRCCQCPCIRLDTLDEYLQGKRDNRSFTADQINVGGEDG